VAILVGSQDHRTQFWKTVIQESFQQNLVDIGSDGKNSLIYIPGYFVKFFFQLIYTDYAN
jgi:hypothetical protein